MGSTNLRDELRAARRAVEEVQAHARSLRAWAAGSRLASRLESDVRRVVEDLDDLDAETGAGSPSGSGVSGSSWALYPDTRHPGTNPRDMRYAGAQPVPVPPRQGEPEFQPECDDEGLGGGWQAEPTARGNGSGSGRAR